MISDNSIQSPKNSSGIIISITPRPCVTGRFLLSCFN